MIKVLPEVKELEVLSSNKVDKSFYVEDRLPSFAKTKLKSFINNSSNNKLLLTKNKKLKKEEYYLTLLNQQLVIEYNDRNGLLYGLITLYQLFIMNKNIYELRIHDYPSFKSRTIMIDISRNRVPKLKTLYLIVDNLALLKINDLQLYIEGKSFYLEKMKKYYSSKDNYLTEDDVIKLTSYCKRRGITLTPNINIFAHNTYWLNQKEFNDLAYKKEGFHWSNGSWCPCGTLDPLNPKAIDFAKYIIDSNVSIYANSSKVVIGGDEPFEFLFPTKIDNAFELYSGYINEMISYVKKYNKHPMMWGDVVKEYENKISCMDKDVTYLQWGYSAKAFNDKTLRFYKKNKLSFYVCSGTSLWLSFTGRSQNMIQNIKRAAHYGKKYNADGFMLTDWSDGGSYSILPSCLLAYSIGACYAYSNKLNKKDLYHYLDKYVFENKLSKFLIDLGNYYLCEDNNISNSTKLFLSYYFTYPNKANKDIGNYSDPVSYMINNEGLNNNEFIRTRDYLINIKKDLKISKNNQYIKEVNHMLALLDVALLNNEFNNNQDSVDKEEIIKKINKCEDTYKKIWMYRNKESDFALSNERLKALLDKFN